jgi:xylulokinase
VIVLGIDLGTQSAKAIAWDGRVVGEGAAPIETRRPAADRAEQDPRVWETAIGAAVAACGVRDVGAIAVTGQLDGCVGVDANGAPLGPCLIWQDRRAAAGAAVLDERTGQIADPSHLGPKAAWLAANGMRAAVWHQPTSYVVARLTGEHVIDHALASTTMRYDLAARAWIDPAQLPRLAHASDVAGTLTADGAALLGLRAGIPVVVGTGDDFATALGADLTSEVAITLGTAEVVGARSDHLVLDRDALVETHAFPTGGYFVENPGWLAGGALRWIESITGGAPPADDADGLVFIPALAGAMSPVWRPTARGTFHGLTPRHTGRHLVRAVLEGCAFACRDVVDRLRALGLPCPSAIALGGGTRVPAWVPIHAAALGIPVATLGGPDATIYGAIKLAVPDAPPLPRAQRFAPGPSLDENYARYRALVAALAPLWS